MNLMKIKQGWKKVLKAASKHLSSDEKDLGSTVVLNDAGWLRSNVAREHFNDDRYDCLFNQFGSFETQCESSSSSFGGKKDGWTESRMSVQQDVVTKEVRSSLQKDAGTRNVGCIDFVDEGELPSYSVEQKRKFSDSF
ncbi:hypothetical protein Tco_0676619 [Tanacetum coccineum]